MKDTELEAELGEALLWLQDIRARWHEIETADLIERVNWALGCLQRASQHRLLRLGRS